MSIFFESFFSCCDFMVDFVNSQQPLVLDLAIWALDRSLPGVDWIGWNQRTENRWNVAMVLECLVPFWWAVLIFTIYHHILSQYSLSLYIYSIYNSFMLLECKSSVTCTLWPPHITMEHPPFDHEFQDLFIFMPPESLVPEKYHKPSEHQTSQLKTV